MSGLIRKLGGLPGKIGAHLALLRRDPERFGRNLLQVTNPALFEERLLDVMDAVPMHICIDPTMSGPPHLNVLSSTLSRSGMTGGPNTIANLALRIARQGIPIRFVASITPSTLDPVWFQRHAAELVGDDRLPAVPIVDACDASAPMRVGPNDIFLASHWTTAQQLKAILPRMKVEQFFYILQEFEPAFYAWSSNFARALETYGMDYYPIFNEAFLADYMLSQDIARLSDPMFRTRATIFEPAVDARVFHPAIAGEAPRPRRLLFYARPTNTRNMFGLGLMALRLAATDPAFAGWEFVAIGGRGSVPPMELGGDHRLVPGPWMDYAAYATSLREADVLLCPMLSPHTSYPVLEMAASGGLSVTNTFATKTQAALEALSDNIIAAAPTVEALAAGLVTAAKRTNAQTERVASINMARDWAETLDPAARRVAELFRQLTLGAG